MRPAVVVLTAAGLATARRIAEAIGGEVYGLAGRADAVDAAFADTVPHLQALFADGRPVVGICAAGILIRAVAPLLDAKQTEPPVLAVAEDASVVVPLLGGHRGGNALARRIAAALGGMAAITTAGDRRFGIALDEPPSGWRLASPAAAKDAMARLLAGERVRLIVESGDSGWLESLPGSPAGTVGIRVTHRRVDADGDELVLHPPVLGLGVGCERGAEPAELCALVDETLSAAGLAPEAVACVVSLDLKADEPAVLRLAESLRVPLRLFDAAALERETPRLANPSEAVFREVGCHGVAEAAALAAAGASGALLVPKRKSARATCAVALSRGDIDPARIGRPRGRLAVVGIGPGVAAWRTAEAVAEIAAASDLVGYGLYLDLVDDLGRGKARHAFPIGAETERVDRALELAAAGRRVALICSGDAGIYALASLAYERLERAGRDDWRRIEVVVAPGISALQAASARAGAPLGHDFCAISLSDLMTPWEAIRTRLEAAAAADFVVALYNPSSRRRAHRYAEALEILARCRTPQTPVVLARCLGRADETVEIVDLAAAAERPVDMLTLVLVGNSATRRVGDRVYTPRGYGGRDV